MVEMGAVAEVEACSRAGSTPLARDARDRCSGDRRLARRHDQSRPCDRRRAIGDAALCQAPIHLVRQPAARRMAAFCPRARGRRWPTRWRWSSGRSSVEAMTMIRDADIDPPRLAASAWRSSAMATRAARRRSTSTIAGSTWSSGCALDRAARRGSADGLPAVPLEEAAAGADVVMLLAPDETLAAIYRTVEPLENRRNARLQPRAGDPFRVHRAAPRPRRGHGRAQGPRLGAAQPLPRRGGDGPRCSQSTRMPAGSAEALALAYGRAIGCGRAGLLASTFAEECEADLFNEAAVVWGGCPKSSSLASIRWSRRGERGSRLYGVRRRVGSCSPS